jgi:hypothetical protein
MKKGLPILAVALVVGCGPQASELQVHSDGRIGPLQIDVSTEAEIRSFAGKPFRVERDFWPGKKGQAGRTLEYRCGRTCRTSYSINNATGKLSDYWTQSPRFVTERGTHVGMSAAKAARLEGRKLVPGCGFPRYIQLRRGPERTFVLAVWRGRIDSMGYLGPHSVYYDGLC